MLDLAAYFEFGFADDYGELLAQARSLFEQCLADGDEGPLRDFVEAQVAAEPPRVELLQQLGDSLEHQLLAQRGARRDVLDRLIALAQDGYGVDITPLLPTGWQREGSAATGAEVVDYWAAAAGLSDDERTLLAPLADIALQTAQRLGTEVDMTAKLSRMVGDWLRGLHATAVRGQWRAEIVKPPAAAFYH